MVLFRLISAIANASTENKVDTWLILRVEDAPAMKITSAITVSSIAAIRTHPALLPWYVLYIPNENNEMKTSSTRSSKANANCVY